MFYVSKMYMCMSMVFQSLQALIISVFTENYHLTLDSQTIVIKLFNVQGGATITQLLLI